MKYYLVEVQSDDEDSTDAESKKPPPSVEYEVVPGKWKDKTSVWNYFLRHKDRGTALCKKCNKVLKTKLSSTSGLLTHLKSIHKIEFESINIKKLKTES